MVTINQFVLIDELNSLDIGFNQSTIRNRYVMVKELVQTLHTQSVLTTDISNIIFVFSKDSIVEGEYPCEGIENAFVTRYRFNNGFTEEIENEECFPFPCLHQLSPVQLSFSRKIFMCIYSIRKSIVHTMCRNGQANGHGFIVGRDTFKFPEEGWYYLEHCCKCHNIQVHGPYKSSSNHLQARSHLDINCVKMHGDSFIMQFETTYNFEVFNNIFGSFSRYGTAFARPKAGTSRPLKSDCQVYDMGDGLGSPAPVLKRRDLTDLGIDLIYFCTGLLTISTRYKLLKASNSSRLRTFIQEKKIMMEKYQQTRTLLQTRLPTIVVL